VSTLVRTIFEQPDPASVRTQHAHVAAALEAKLPQAAAHLDDARDDILAFTVFPARSGGRSGPTTRRNG
jgi:transposase-like protein